MRDYNLDSITLNLLSNCKEIEKLMIKKKKIYYLMNKQILDA